MNFKKESSNILKKIFFILAIFTILMLPDEKLHAQGSPAPQNLGGLPQPQGDSPDQLYYARTPEGPGPQVPWGQLDRRQQEIEYEARSAPIPPPINPDPDIGSSDQTVITGHNDEAVLRHYGYTQARWDSLAENEKQFLREKLIAAQTIPRLQEKISKGSDDSGVCIFSTIGWDNYSDAQENGASFWNCIEQMLYGILKVFTWALGFAVWIFNIVFEMMVVGMSNFINKIQAIGTVWKVFRDVANICFIFILLYLAISTILGINEHGIKHTLSKLILVAILMNFSMFFAKVVVDASNILAISFYKKIQPLENTANFDELVIKTYEQKDNKINGIAGAFMGSFSLQEIFNDKSSSNLDESELFAAKPDAGTTFIMGSIVIFIVFCIFLAASIIFIKRMTVIIILIMTSSLAFAATLFHQTEGKAREWWEKLMAEAFYAPVFVAIIWLALLVMTDPHFSGTFSQKQAEGYGWFNVGTVINYIIVINFFVMALVVGEKMGASGASGAMKSYKWLKSNLGGRPIQAGFRRYVGSRAYNWLEGKQKGKPHAFVTWATAAMAGQRKILGSSKIAEIVANVSRDALKGLTDAQIAGAGKSFRDDFADTQHAIAEHEYEIKDNITSVAKFYSQLSRDGTAGKELGVRVALEKEWEKKDSKFHADVLTSLEDLMKSETDATKKEEYRKSLEHLSGRLSPSQKDEMERKKEGPLAYHRQKFDEFIDGVDDGHGNKTGGLNNRDAEITVLSDQLRRTSDAGEKAKIQKKIDKLNNLEAELRAFVKGLNATQQSGLRLNQKMDERIRPVLDSETILSMSKSLTQEERDKLGKDVVEPSMNRFETRVKAQYDGTSGARTAILEQVNKYRRDVMGHKDNPTDPANRVFSDDDILNMTEDEMHQHAIQAMEYYDKFIKGYDSSMTQAARNMSRTMGINGGGDGEKIKREGDVILKTTKADPKVNLGRPPTPK